MIQVRPSEPGLALPNDQDATGRTFGPAELARLAVGDRVGTLTSTKGAQVPELEARFAALLGVEHAVACSSGTAAVHAAIAAIDPEPGDEIVTTPITDMGALAPILYQGAIPVFADVDAQTGNVTAATVAEPALGAHGRDRRHPPVRQPVRDRGRSARSPTSAGSPSSRTARRRSSTRRAGRLVGTIGAIGCFSSQQGKHMTTGEGGLVVVPDPTYARRVRMFVNKAWPYGEDSPDHEFLALNSRMTELQGAVANAQLDRLEAGVAQRMAMADRLTRDARRRSRRHRPGRPRRTTWRRSGSTRSWSTRHHPGWSPGARAGAAGRGHRLGAPVHPEAGVRVPGLHRAAHLRVQPVAVLARPPEALELPTRAVHRNVARSSITSWCFPGTNATRRSTSTSSPRPSAPPS